MAEAQEQRLQLLKDIRDGRQRKQELEKLGIFSSPFEHQTLLTLQVRLSYDPYRKNFGAFSPFSNGNISGF
ncbi:hypothetical protein H920_03828 [Fukomys damarensis]|uniref:Uncharacterized protein n=1 Tax=Fukomys damarensis TaxID=885580 RepID=A0A091DWZ5_FUKDA|nr:hypothetical protein H920_03828 [Fukomys damarensis]